MNLKTSNALVHKFTTLVDGGSSVTLHYPASETEKAMKLIQMQGKLLDVEYRDTYSNDSDEIEGES